MEKSIDLTSSFFGCGLRLSTELRELDFKFSRHIGPLHAHSPLAQANIWACFSRSLEMFIDRVAQLDPFVSKYVFFEDDHFQNPELRPMLHTMKDMPRRINHYPT